MKLSESNIHRYMRAFLREQGWLLVAGEYPGGSDHELHPLNVVDRILARDNSPEPRRHSFGEVIPDLVALRNRALFIGEAKPRYDDGDRVKLVNLLTERRDDLVAALEKFALERSVPDLLPVDTLEVHPVLIFPLTSHAPPPTPRFSYLRIVNQHEAYFEGVLGTAT